MQETARQATGNGYWPWLLIGLAAGGCGRARAAIVPDVGPRTCPEATSIDEASRFGSVFLDNRRIATNLPVRRTNAFPETYEIVGDEPPELAAVPVERIDLVQYLRGPDAEQSYALCPGTVALLFVTKQPDGS